MKTLGKPPTPCYNLPVLIIEINPDQIAPEAYQAYDQRTAARGIILDSAGRLGVLYVAKHHYHKLPGGGVEPGEDLLAALRRECQEELGCDVQVEAEFARTLEIRREHNLVQRSVYFTGHVDGALGQSNFTDQELAHNFTAHWMALADARQSFTQDQPVDLAGWFISQRDTLVLLAYLKQRQPRPIESEA